MKTVSSTCSCIICRQEYSVKGIHTHFERSHGTPAQQSKYSSGYNNRYNDAAYIKNVTDGINLRFAHTLGELVEYTVQCHKCAIDMTVTERSTQFPSKKQYFCSRGCSNSRVMTTTTRQLISKKLTTQVMLTKECKMCDGQFDTKRKKKAYCSVKCSNQHRAITSREARSAFRNYKADCEFKFNLADFPNEYDFSIIDTHGWYKPTNRGNNLGGVSRDHKISVRYGFDNNIPSGIIAHPANCQLMRQQDNSVKYTNCSMTLDELIEKISSWEERYSTRQ